MISKSFDEKDFEKYSGQTMYGRIKEYSHSRGYGFIFTEEGKDIFVSSYELGKLEDKISVGTTVKFTPKQWKERYVASDITIVENVGYNEVIKCPNRYKDQTQESGKDRLYTGRIFHKKDGYHSRRTASAWIFVKGFGLCFFQNQKRVRVSLFPGRKSGERGWIHSGSKGILSGAVRAIL